MSTKAIANPLARHYTAFRVDAPGRILLTGHSHQAWPDVAREGQIEAFDDAAATLDEKWERAFAKAETLRDGFRALIDDADAEIALGANTHELVVRMLSALPLDHRRRLVTTDGEFHTLRRQLGRLGETGLDVVRVPAEPVATLAERLAAQADRRTAAVLVSAVLFESSRVVPELGRLAETCAHAGSELLVDVYHALGPVRWSVREEGLQRAWIVGGGYKYLQFGEGNCFLRLPAHADELRPAITGWYAEFAELAGEHDPNSTAYPRGAARYAGSTYDPTSHYRAVRVLRFFAEQDLTRERLEHEYTRQVALLTSAFDALDAPPAVIARNVDAARRGGFLALRTPHAAELQRALRLRGILTDNRGPTLRLGPAPYLADAQLEAAIAALGEALREV